MTEKGTFMVATLVDWNNEDQLDKTWKKVCKVFKKKLNGKNPKKNKLNTFVVTEVELHTLPPRDVRISAEAEIKKYLKEYADAIHEAHQKHTRKQGTIARIYKKGLIARGRKDLYEKYAESKAKSFDTIEKAIEKVGEEGGVILWDLPGFEGDKLIQPECVATFNDYPEHSEALVDIIDEVLIANFSRRFLPFSYELIKEAEKEFTELVTLSSKLSKEDKIPDDLIIPLQTFIGVISGIQEVLKLFKREVTKVHQTATEAFKYLLQLPSDELKEWATVDNPELGNEIIVHIDSVMDIIVANKPKLRDLLNGSQEMSNELTNELMECMVDMDLISGGLLAWVHRFQQLPSFTTLDEGIAYEELEGETYWPKSKDAMIEAQILFKTFKRGSSYIYALRGVDVTINKGEFIVIRGPSGAGKTTLLNMIAGLDVPQRGGVFFMGQDIVNMKDKTRSKLRRENFAFIFQSYALIPHLTAFENTKLPLDLSGLSGELVEGIQKLLDDVGIGEFATHKPALLSGGQMQRLGIARALANQPKILFADEPTGDLDEETGLAVMELLKKYHEETGMTIILVTHDEKVAKFATREIFLLDGRVVDKLEDN
ncbi:MAG: ABC transporter ATP-binding protein [Candidatus Heimdallarchaeota archaeon]|nr:ABC transporter ATP-binding protein [Candidatus Heimdallarchaeota archaeon]MCK5047878.1 ABC transporter ATP-binding protein [Candidatus Heimdallarchaeota archaeon]